MMRRQPLFSALTPQVLASGLMPDRHPLRAVLWESSEGLRFYDGKVRHQWGDNVLLMTGDNEVRGIGQQKLLDGSRVLWIAEGQYIWRWDGIYVDRVLDFGSWTRYAGDLLPPSFYDFTFIGDWAFVNSGNGAVRFWDGNAFGVIAEMPQDVLMLEKKFSFLMAFGTGDRGTGVSWSDADDVNKWVAAANNLAGTIYVDDFDTAIIAQSRLGQYNVAYGADQVALITFLGSPFYFGQRVVLDGIGAVGKQAVASNGRINVGVGRNGIWLTDGNDYQYIDQGLLRDYLQEQINWEQQARIVVARNDKTNCFDFHFPMRGSLDINEGWSYDPVSQGWSPITPATFQVERKLFGTPLASRAPGQVLAMEAVEYNRRVLSLRTRPLVMQVQSEAGLTDVHTDTRLDELEIFCKEATNVEFRIGSQYDPADTVEWTEWAPLTDGKQTYLLEQYPSNVYHVLEFRAEPSKANVIDGVSNVVDGADNVIARGNAWQFDLQGFLLFGSVEGSKRD